VSQNDDRGAEDKARHSEPDATRGASTSSSATTPTTATTTPTSVPLRAQIGSGFAMISPLTDNNNGSMKLIYWQDSAGNVIEGRYPGANFIQSSNATVVQADDALPGTPLSAITWTIDGSVTYVSL
jgi:hypothetical protein